MPVDDVNAGVNVFTFQHVSINSLFTNTQCAVFKHLHSNMYLLIPLNYLRCHPSNLFTFQHVSINSGDADTYVELLSTFTFQHVSINSKKLSNRLIKIS